MSHVGSVGGPHKGARAGRAGGTRGPRRGTGGPRWGGHLRAAHGYERATQRARAGRARGAGGPHRGHRRAAHGYERATQRSRACRARGMGGPHRGHRRAAHRARVGLARAQMGPHNGTSRGCTGVRGRPHGGLGLGLGHRYRWHSRRGIVARPLNMLHDTVGLINLGRAALEHLIPKTGAQPMSEETNNNMWILHELAPCPTLLKCLDVIPDG